MPDERSSPPASTVLDGPGPSPRVPSPDSFTIRAPAHIPLPRRALERFLYLTNPFRCCNSYPAAIRDTDWWETLWTAADPLRFWYWRAKNFRARHAHPPALSARGEEILKTLRAEGIAITPGFVSSDLVLAMRRTAREYGKAVSGIDIEAPRPGQQFHLNNLGNDLAMGDPILTYLRSPELFDIAGAYLGFVPRLRRIALFFNQPIADMTGTENVAKHFHTDTHDFRVLKFFIYLADTRPENGPFTYVRGTHFHGARRGVVCRIPSYSVIPSEEMETFVPSKAWIDATGPAGTAIFAETSGVHRGGRTRAGYRLMVIAEYASHHPWLRLSHDIEDRARETPR